MATSNIEAVRGALQSLSEVLDPYIERVTAKLVPAGKDWTVLLAAKDAEKRIRVKEYSRTDPQDQFRIITEPIAALGYIFNDHLSRGEQGFVGELRSVRNDVAHFKPFSPDDAVRALDTIERVMRAIGAVREADSVRTSRLDILRGNFEQQTRKAVRAATALPGTADAELPYWREVLRPHPDVASGRYSNAEFAADLYSVAVQRNAAKEYQDPVEFFRRTYLTDGLKELLRRAVDRIAGAESANPVINLQTTFGGGKTHSMLAVWHLFSGRPLHEFPQSVQDLLGGEHADVLGRPVERVADPRHAQLSGVALWARVCLGEIGLEDVPRHMPAPTTFTPSAESGAYAARYAEYRKLYGRLKSLYHRLNARKDGA